MGSRARPSICSSDRSEWNGNISVLINRYFSDDPSRGGEQAQRQSPVKATGRPVVSSIGLRRFRLLKSPSAIRHFEVFDLNARCRHPIGATDLLRSHPVSAAECRQELHSACTNKIHMCDIRASSELGSLCNLERHTNRLIQCRTAFVASSGAIGSTSRNVN